MIRAWFEQWLPKPRCWVHIAFGAALPWLDMGMIIGGSIGYCSYQYLQYKYRTSRKDRFKDDSYLDIKEWLITLIISAVIKQLVGV